MPLRKAKSDLCSAGVKLVGAVCDEPALYDLVIAYILQGAHRGARLLRGVLQGENFEDICLDGAITIY